MKSKKTMTKKATVDGEEKLDPSQALIKNPSARDILMGRGKPFFSHPGNVRMLDIVKQRYPTFREINFHFRRAFCESVLDEIYGDGTDGAPIARFLRLSTIGGYWIEVDRATALKKTFHTFHNHGDQIRRDARIEQIKGQILRDAKIEQVTGGSPVYQKYIPKKAKGEDKFQKYLKKAKDGTEKEDEDRSQKRPPSATRGENKALEQQPRSSGNRMRESSNQPDAVSSFTPPTHLMQGAHASMQGPESIHAMMRETLARGMLPMGGPAGPFLSPVAMRQCAQDMMTTATTMMLMSQAAMMQASAYDTMLGGQGCNDTIVLEDGGISATDFLQQNSQRRAQILAETVQDLRSPEALPPKATDKKTENVKPSL